MKRNVRNLESEIKNLKKEHNKNFPPSILPKLVYTRKEIESIVHIAWLEGYLRALRDERGLK